jgi:hypothetical protein
MFFVLLFVLFLKFQAKSQLVVIDDDDDDDDFVVVYIISSHRRRKRSRVPRVQETLEPLPEPFLQREEREGSDLSVRLKLWCTERKGKCELVPIFYLSQPTVTICSNCKDGGCFFPFDKRSEGDESALEVGGVEEEVNAADEGEVMDGETG